MAVKSNFASGEVLTASDVNTYLTNGGLVYIAETIIGAGATTSISFNNVFTSTFDNYQVLIDNFTPSIGNLGLNFRLRVGGVDAFGATDYKNAFLGLTDTGAASNFTSAGQDNGSTGMFNSSTTVVHSSATMIFFNPARTVRTNIQSHAQLFAGQLFHRTGSVLHDLTTAYDGFTLLLSGAGNITTLRVRIYGYRQA